MNGTLRSGKSWQALGKDQPAFIGFIKGGERRTKEEKNNGTTYAREKRI